MAHLAVSALQHTQFWVNSFHICRKWALARDAVSHTMTFDLDLYLQGYLAVMPIYIIIFIYDTNTTHEGTMCHVPFSGQQVKVTRVVRIFAVGTGGILVDHSSTISSCLLFTNLAHFPDWHDYWRTYLKSHCDVIAYVIIILSWIVMIFSCLLWNRSYENILKFSKWPPLWGRDEVFNQKW